MFSELAKGITGLFLRPRGAAQNAFWICCSLIISSISLPALWRWISKLIQTLRTYRHEREDLSEKGVDGKAKSPSKDTTTSNIAPGNRNRNWWLALFQTLFLWRLGGSPKPSPQPESGPPAELESSPSIQSPPVAESAPSPGFLRPTELGSSPSTRALPAESAPTIGSASTAESTPSSQSPPPAEFPIQVLYQDENATIDIVAVHGLAANPEYAWVWQPKNNPPNCVGYPDKHFNWLQELLPIKLSSARVSCRVMTFNNKSEWFMNAPQQRLSNISDKLLKSLQNKRKEEQASDRPLIFIGHSFGGNLIEQAIVSASQHKSEYAEIAESTAGVVFLGTPHRGSAAATWGALIASLAPPEWAFENRILKDLEPHSGTLTDRLHDFSRWLFCESVPVVCCFEQLTTDYSSRMGSMGKYFPLKELVVPEDSACIDGHPKISIHADHFKINKFYGPDDPSFKIVYPEIEHMAQNAEKMLKRRRFPQEIPMDPSAASISNQLQTCLKGMGVTNPKDILEDIRLQKGSRLEGTCEWILKREEFSAWGAENKSQLFRLIGSPGIGKTTLSTFLVEVLQTKVQKSPQKVFAYFFFDDKIESRNNPNALLRSLIWQLLLQRNDLFRHIQSDFESQTNLFNNFSTLWRIFKGMVQDEHAGEVFILLDALDECNRSTRNGLLRHINDLFQASAESKRKHKLLITCRPEIRDIEDALNGVGCSLRIDAAGINEDLSRFIDSKVTELAKRRGWSEKLKDKVKEALTIECGGTFLWVSLMLKDLEGVLKQDVDKQLKSLPNGLDETYTSILDRIDSKVQDVAKFILHCMVAAKRPLRKIEVMTAYSFMSEKASIPLHGDLELYDDIVSACSSILYISNLERGDDATLNFCHQSVKDFLLSNGPDAKRKWYHTTTDEANLVIFQACWRCLSAEDSKVGNLVIKQEKNKSATPYPMKKSSWELEEHYSTYRFLDYTKGWWKDHAMASYPAWLRGLKIDMTEAPLLRDQLLLRAAKKGNKEMVSHLIEVGANHNERSNYGQTPLSLAAEHGHEEVTKVLLTLENIDVNASDWGSRSPLLFAVQCEKTTTAQLLLAAGADVNTHNKRGDTPLHRAAGNGSVDMAKLLLAREDIDINAQTKDGYTPLHRAIWSGKEDIVKLLLAREDIDINAQDEDGYTPLHIAVLSKREDIVKLLLAREEIDINAQDENGYTPLHIAIEDGKENIVKLLLARGEIDLNVRDKKGRTPLDLASHFGEENIAKLLRAARKVNGDSED